MVPNRILENNTPEVIIWANRSPVCNGSSSKQNTNAKAQHPMQFRGGQAGAGKQSKVVIGTDMTEASGSCDGKAKVWPKEIAGD